MLSWMLVTILAMVLVIAVIVGWSIIFPLYHAAAFTAGWGSSGAGLWVIMGLGHAFLSLVLIALVWILAAMLRRHRLLHLQDIFIDTVTHELRTPLSGLRLGIETMQRQPLDHAHQSDCLRRMHGDLERLQAFIDHLIEANRLVHGRRGMVRERFDLATLLTSCQERISHRYGLNEPWCTVTGPTREIIGERSAFEIIVLNLLDNAVKYALDRPVVTLEASLDKTACRLRVCDQGAGFPPHQHQQLFHRFYRFQGSGAKPTGTGLGLYIVAELCRHLHGHYHASSDGTDRGACFTVELPVEMPPCTENDDDA